MKGEDEMKKKLSVAIGGIVAAGILGLGIFHSSTTEAEAAMTTDEIKNMVTNQYPGEIIDVKQGTEFNRAVYDLKITGDQKEYSLKLDGDNGDVLNITERPVKTPERKENPKQKTRKKDSKPQNKESEKSTDETQPTEQKGDKPRKTVITAQEAGEIALKEFSGEIDEIELDEEDGRLIYEVEIERGEQEAEIEIDAYTGEVIIIEIDED